MKHGCSGYDTKLDPLQRFKFKNSEEYGRSRLLVIIIPSPTLIWILFLLLAMNLKDVWKILILKTIIWNHITIRLEHLNHITANNDYHQIWTVTLHYIILCKSLVFRKVTWNSNGLLLIIIITHWNDIIANKNDWLRHSTKVDTKEN